MTRREGYFYSLLLPFVLPLAVILAAAATHTLLKSHSALGWASLAALLQVTFGGLQYFLFLFIVYGWGKSKTQRQISRMSWALPLWFWPWCTVFLLGAAALYGRAKLFILIGLAAIPFGYAYVLIAHLLLWLLAKTRLVVD